MGESLCLTAIASAPPVVVPVLDSTIEWWTVEVAVVDEVPINKQHEAPAGHKMVACVTFEVNLKTLLLSGFALWLPA